MSLSLPFTRAKILNGRLKGLVHSFVPHRRKLHPIFLPEYAFSHLRLIDGMRFTIGEGLMDEFSLLENDETCQGATQREAEKTLLSENADHAETLSRV